MKLRLRSVLTAGGVVVAAAAAVATSGLRAENAPNPPQGPVPAAGQYCPPQGQDCPPEVKKPWRWSERWYDEQAQLPVGSRQKKKRGKLWPPYPRPTVKEQEFTHRFHAAHYWPFPYLCDDRAYVREVSALQIDAGWMTATTLYDYHFDEETHEVNSAGRLHLRWIIESAPMARRMVYVQSTLEPETSEIRVASVRRDLALMLGPEPAPPVMLRIAPLYGRPALEIDLIRRAERDNLQTPHIPYTPNSSGGGGSSGGGSGSGM